MAVISWSERMSTGVAELDADHKILIRLTNDLHRSIGDDEEFSVVGSVLKALADYVEHHFAREERVLEACRYPTLASHHQFHRELADQVQALHQSYAADPTSVRANQCLAFLRSWLIEHICSTDMDYRAWVIGRSDTHSLVSTVTMTGDPARPRRDWACLKVLVVDDNANFRQIVRTILAGMGTEDVTAVADVPSAKLELMKGGWDILITDWRIGRENGLVLTHWVRQQPHIQNLPVVVVSGHEGASNRDLAIAQGADEFLEKPISARSLLVGLSRLINRLA